MKITPLAAIAATTCALVADAALAAPDMLHLQLHQRLNAAPEAVWAVVGRFPDMSWHPAVAMGEMTADSPAEPAPGKSTRILHLHAPSGDPTITETLTALDADKRCYSYVIAKVDPAVLPVTDYASTLCILDQGNKADVVWKGEFKSATGDDKAAVEAVTGVYQGGLDALAERFGAAD